jgi:hypothetical protein
MMKNGSGLYMLHFEVARFIEVELQVFQRPRTDLLSQFSPQKRHLLLSPYCHSAVISETQPELEGKLSDRIPKSEEEIPREMYEITGHPEFLDPRIGMAELVARLRDREASMVVYTEPGQYRIPQEKISGFIPSETREWYASR